MRSTEDVDCVVQIGSHLENRKLEKKLERLGFLHCTDKGAPLCRWLYQKIKVDIMPTDPAVLGFSNRWYLKGIETAQRVALPSGNQIHIFSVPYFLASKIEAFKGRGQGDYYGSKDLEDVVELLDGRKKDWSRFICCP